MRSHSRRHLTGRWARCAAVLLLALAVVPATGGVAEAGGPLGTVVFVRAHDVWIARGDGTGIRQLTADGTEASPYSSPSEDDAGNVVAVHGLGSSSTLVRMDQSGNRLQEFVPPVPSLSLGFAQVSPDGQTVAYGGLFGWTDCNFDPCHTLFEHQLHYTAATSSASRFGSLSGVAHATWVTNGRTLLESTTPQVVSLHDVASSEATDWFTACTSELPNCDNTDYYHYTPAESRQGTRFASAMEILPWSGPATQELLILETAGVATGTPQPISGVGCEIQGAPLPTEFPSPDQMTVRDPSWSPDGSALVAAFRDPATGWSVHRVDLPDLADCATMTDAVLIADASEPSWGAAELAPYAPTPTPTPTTTPTPTPTTGPAPSPSPSPTPGTGGHTGASGSGLTFAGHAPVVKGRRHVGSRMHLSLGSTALAKAFRPHATKVSYRWLRDGHAIKHAHRARYRLTRADRRHRISCRVTGTRAGHSPAHVTTRKVRIR